MSPKIPTISHLQFLTLDLLLRGERAGRTLREEVRRFGVRQSLAAFYQLMARLDRDGLVVGWYEQVTIGGQVVTERRYRLTAAGRAAWAETRAFYAEAALPSSGTEPASA